MSALGIWNSRYEGGPCYAACMETFTLYSFINKVIIHQLPSAGRDVITRQAELTNKREGCKPKGCANDLPLRQCQWSMVNLSQLLTCGCIHKCFQPSLKIFIGLALLEFEDKDIDQL